MQRSLAFVLVLVVIGGCDSDGGGNGATAPSPIATSLSLASAPQVSQIVQVTATASFSDGTTKDVTSAAAWSSSDTAIATVSSSGLVTALGGGDVDITATYEGVSATIRLTLTASAPNVTSISVTGPISLELSASAQFTATATRSDGSTENVTSSVTWTSSNTTVATVTASGTVTANQGGVANIRATLDGLSDEVSLTVTAPPPGPTSTPNVTSISVTGPISLELGASAQFTATATRSDGSTENVTSSVTWTSSNTTSQAHS